MSACCRRPAPRLTARTRSSPPASSSRAAVAAVVMVVAAAAPSSAGLLLATAQEEKEAGSYGPSLMPVCRHFRPLAQSDHPTSSLYPLPRRRKLRLREEKACPGLCSREGKRCGARRVLRASLWSPLYRPSWLPEHPRLPHHGAQCSHLGRAALEGMWRSLPQGQVWIQSPASAC